MDTHETPGRGWYQAGTVRDAARGRWPEVLSQLGVRTELLTSKHGPCPGCGGRDRFRFDDRDGDGTFICSQGGGGVLAGDGIELLKHVHGWEWKRCLEAVGRLLLPDAVRSAGPRRALGESTMVAPRPVAAKQDKRPPFDLTALQNYVASVEPIDRAWLKARSKVPVEKLTSADFLEALYRTDDRVLIFTNYYSQGDFLYWVGKEKPGFRLAAERNVRAVPSVLPTSGKMGVWFLCNPATGKWDKIEKRTYKDGVLTVEHEWTRRSQINVTDWRYLMLESDDAPEDLWIRALAKCGLPICAIYSSGGRSLHALVKVDAGSKAELDVVRDFFIKVLSPLGADPGALTSVRLTRLPGCYREGFKDKTTKKYVRYENPVLQELVYLNPAPVAKPLLTLKPRT